MGIEDLANMGAEVADDDDDGGEAEAPAAPPPPEPKAGEKGVKPVEGDADDDEGDKAAPKPKKKPAEEGDEDAGDDGEESDDTEGEPEPPAHTAIDDKETYEIAGEKVTGAELKKRLMLHSDYSRKRGEDAAKVREAEARSGQHEQRAESFKRYWGMMLKDPEFMRDELEHYAPDAFEAMLVAIGTEEQRLGTLDPDSRRAEEENRTHRRNGRRNGRVQQAQQAGQQRQQQTEHSKAMTAKYREWLPVALTEAGLTVEGDDEHNREAHDLVVDRIQRDYGRGRDYTQDEFNSAAHAVAKSKTGKALLAQKGKLDPAEIEKALGAEGVKKFLAYQADKVRGGKQPPPASGKAAPAKQRKVKEKTTLAELQRLRDDYGA